MSDGTEHRESPDRFSRFMKERLENHRVSLEPGEWETIATYLKRKKRIRAIRLTAGMVAAAMLAGLLWLSTPSDIPVLQEQIALQEERIEQEPLQQESGTVDPRPTPTVIDRPAITRSASMTREKTIKEEVAESEIIPKVQEECEPQENDQKEDAVPATSARDDENTSRSSKENTPSTSPPERTSPVRQPIGKRQDRGKWLIAAAVGTGSGNSFLNGMNGGNDPLFDFGPGSGLKPPPTWNSNNNSITDPSEYANISHSIPISVGITVRKDINQIFAVETGLSYTYLSSDLRKNMNRLSDQLELHYIGVPVNLVGYIINQPRWNIYLSGGVMVEKGLRAIYTERVFHTDRVHTQESKTSVSGVQVSLNGAVGVAYRLFDAWSIYAEPKLYYYFDTDQPISVRTEHPFGAGINLGVRFHFNN